VEAIASRQQKKFIKKLGTKSLECFVASMSQSISQKQAVIRDRRTIKKKRGFSKKEKRE
jgi:hypothetical protein